MAKKLDWTGMQFGELVALTPAEKRNDKYTGGYDSSRLKARYTKYNKY